MCCISSKHISWWEETSKNLIQYETRDQVQEETIDHQGDNSLFYFVLMLNKNIFLTISPIYQLHLNII